jgi:cystathionine gamma-synthase
MRIETDLIHAGQEPDPTTGAVTLPIHVASTFKQDAVGTTRNGYEYARSGNPTRHALEECLAALEGGSSALAFASGLAAEDTVLRSLLEPGDHVVLGPDAYGGTHRLVARVLSRWGVTHSTAATNDVAAIVAAITPATKIVWVETPSNPLMGIVDLAALAWATRERSVLLVADNTFASPYLQQPLRLGADIVIHSTTKYLGGHSDVVGGAAVFADAELATKVAYHQNAMGAVPGPFDSFLVLRGIKTLAVRMDRHCENAARVVDALLEHPKVTAVLYPGLESHPGHRIAVQQMRDFGGMLSFRVAGGEAAARRVVEATRLFTLAESLGGVESLIELPAAMTHASVAGTALQVPGDLIRVSVGIEAAEDLIVDLLQALDKA